MQDVQEWLCAGHLPREALISKGDASSFLLRGNTMSIRQRASFLALAIPGLLFLAQLAALPTCAAAEPERVTQANYKQAFHYSSAFLRQFIYDTAVTPNWIGKSDAFWYAYRTSKG